MPLWLRRANPHRAGERGRGSREGLEAQGKTKQATDAYQQMIRLFPETPEAKKALDRIAKAQREAGERVRMRKR